MDPITVNIVTIKEYDRKMRLKYTFYEYCIGCLSANPPGRDKVVAIID